VGRAATTKWRWLCASCAITVLIVICLVGVRPARAQGRAAPDEVKAAFLYNFAKFVEWPKPAPERYVFCVLFDDGFAETIRRALRGEKLHDREIDVRYAATLDDLRDADPPHVLFVPVRAKESYAETLRALRRDPVLTVGDEPTFTEIGGVISFEKRLGKIGFAVNRRAAEEAGLELGSQLLGLARIVDEPRETER
jgi:hypothetical protein